MPCPVVAPRRQVTALKFDALFAAHGWSNTPVLCPSCLTKETGERVCVTARDLEEGLRASLAPSPCVPCVRCRRALRPGDARAVDIRSGGVRCAVCPTVELDPHEVRFQRTRAAHV